MFDIIIPVYKTPVTFVKECLDSINNQTMTDYKVWVCDGTPHEWKRYDELQALYKNYPNLNVVEQTGKGVSQARNQIIEMGEQPYVAFLDSDDTWDNDYLATYKEAIEKTENSKIKVWFGEVLETSIENHLHDLMAIGIDSKIGMMVEKQSRLQFYPMINFLPVEYHPHFHVCSPLWFSGTIIERNALEKTDLFDESLKIGEDTMLLLEVLTKGYGSQYIYYCGVNRRTHPQQLTKTADNEKTTTVLEKLFTERWSYMIDEIENSKDFDIVQREALMRHHKEGRHYGISNRDCHNRFALISEEEYEIESL